MSKVKFQSYGMTASCGELEITKKGVVYDTEADKEIIEFIRKNMRTVVIETSLDEQKRVVEVSTPVEVKKIELPDVDEELKLAEEEKQLKQERVEKEKKDEEKERARTAKEKAEWQAKHVKKDKQKKVKDVKAT